MKGPTKPNKTQVATGADNVMTPPDIARFIVNYFQPHGECLDPCRGQGAFYDALPTPKSWCEIKDGRDFLTYDAVVDWIITNPPYSIYDAFLLKAFAVSANVVFFCPIAKAFKSNKIEAAVLEYGGLKEIVFMGGGGAYGFDFGFPVGCLYYAKNYKGRCKITHTDFGYRRPR